MNRNLCSVEVAEFVLQVNIFIQSKYDQTLIFVCFSQIVNVDMINGFERRRATHTYPKMIGEGNGNLFQYSCLGNPMDRGAWWAAALRVAKESDTT